MKQNISNPSFLESIQIPHKPCVHPWFYLWINAAGDATVCPQNRTRLGSLEDTSLDEIWNSPNLQEIRKNFLNEEYEKAGCEKECPFLRGLYGHAQEQIPTRELIFPDINMAHFAKNSSAYKNLQKGIEDYQENSLKTIALPVVLDCQSILACNASCIMCGQPHTSKLKHSQTIKDKITQASKYLSAIRWQGGEVFLDKAFASDVQNVANAGDDAMEKIIITNGSLLDDDKIEELINTRGNLQFIVSMDGATPETVNKIRYKLSYEKIFNTITYLAEKQKYLGIKNLILWNYTVMRSNVADVLHAITVANELGIDINLAAIQGHYPDENFFGFPLLDLQTWQHYVAKWEKAITSADVTVSGLEGLKYRYRF